MTSGEAAAAGGREYDGFISYSHAADDLLAPRLQAGLQRFAKPWWKRRALRLFRDEASLSANPHLWSSITGALDSSEWFVLLLSPDAAASPWVNQEIEYWKSHKDPTRILPVLTDGTFGWDGSDVSGASVPEQLQGVFSEEPRWVDLRFAKDEEQLDLKDPRFADAVADIASALRGVPKDELASEEVKQHRRTVRTAWAAGVALLALTVAAVGFGIQSASNAEAEAEQRAEAEAQREIAQEEAERADRQAQIARSRELAAAAASVLEADPELSSLLAILSIRRLPENAAPSVESIRTLRVADRSNLLRLRLSTGPGPSRQQIESTADGETIVFTNTVAGEVSAVEPSSGEILWSRPFVDDLHRPLDLAIAPDGSVVAVLVGEDGGKLAEVLMLSLATGETVTTLPQPCRWGDTGDWPLHPFSHDGKVFAFYAGTQDCDSDRDSGWVSFVDTTTWAEVNRLQIPGWFEHIDFATNADRLIVWNLARDREQNRTEVRSYPELKVLRTFEHGSQATIGPSGDQVVLVSEKNDRFAIYDVETGDLMGYIEGQDTFSGPAVFSPDGNALVLLSRNRNVLVNASDGTLINRFGVAEVTRDGAYVGDRNSFATVDRNHGTLRIWDFDRGEVAGTPLGVDPDVEYHLNPGAIVDGPNAAVIGIALRTDRPSAGLHIVDEITGATKQTIEALNAAQLPDGRFVVVPLEATMRADTRELDTVIGGLTIWDPQTGAMIPVTECSISTADYFDPTSPTPLCADGELPFGVDVGGPQLLVSPNGSTFVATSADVDNHRLLRVWDTSTLDALQTFRLPASSNLLAIGDTWVAMTEANASVPTVLGLDDGEVLAEFNLDTEDNPIASPGGYGKVIGNGRYLLSHTTTQIVVIDTSTWTEVARWDAHNGTIRGMAPSPNGTLLATAGEDEVVRIWDLTNLISGGGEMGLVPGLVDDIPTEIVSDLRWITDDLLGLAMRRPGRWITVSLNPNALVDQVLSRLTRSFTPLECDTYRIDPCPTLEELKSG